MRIPTLVCSVAVCLIGCAARGVAPVAAPGDQQQGAPARDLAPSPLEAFAARATATVVWSRTIGSLESQESRATITALIIEDRTSKPSVMRGLRMDLVHISTNFSCDWKYWAWSIMCQRVNAAVYIEEARLEAVRNALEHGAAELRPFEYISQYQTTAWGQASTGLIVCGYQFSDRQRSDLAALFTRAIAELR